MPIPTASDNIPYQVVGTAEPTQIKPVPKKPIAPLIAFFVFLMLFSV